MNTEDLVVDDDAQGEKVEHVSEIMPNISISIFSSAFRIKAVRLGNTT